VDQLIHAWRGTQARNVLAFEKRFPGHATIVLSRNFRCRAEILDAASRSIAHNHQRVANALIAVRGPGGLVRVCGFGDERREAAWVAAIAAQALRDGTAPADVLLLARTGYASEPLQHALVAAGVPHRVLGSLGLYERSEVRDALAYLTLLANPAGAHALRRPLGAPRRGVGAVGLGLATEQK
jgi:DNA helicase-2/ATP-dependent DNA helicase PcrA